MKPALLQDCSRLHSSPLGHREKESKLKYRKKPWNIKDVFTPNFGKPGHTSPKLVAQIIPVQGRTILFEKPHKSRSQPKALTAVSPPHYNGTSYWSWDFSSPHQPLSLAADLTPSILSSASSSHLSPSCPGFPLKAVHPCCLFTSSSPPYFLLSFNLPLLLPDSLAPIHPTQVNLKPEVKTGSVLQVLIIKPLQPCRDSSPLYDA